MRIPPDNEKSHLIRIEGDPQGVQEASKELLELASRMVSITIHSLSLPHTRPHWELSFNLSSLLQENERTKDLIIEQRFHRAIIGQKGEKIKDVRDKFPEVSHKPCCRGNTPDDVRDCGSETSVSKAVFTQAAQFWLFFH